MPAHFPSERKQGVGRHGDPEHLGAPAEVGWCLHRKNPLGVVGPGIVSAADARHRSLRDHGALGIRALTRPADRSLVPVPIR
jgi:hypothetical protein